MFPKIVHLDTTSEEGRGRLSSFTNYFKQIRKSLYSLGNDEDKTMKSESIPPMESTNNLKMTEKKQIFPKGK
jgi:hypothetical protein